MDYYMYDDASADRSNKYSWYSNNNNSYLSHQDNYYQITYPSRVTESNAVRLALGEIQASNFELSIDVLYTTTSSGKQFTLQVYADNIGNWDNHSECGTWSGSKTVGSIVNGTNYRNNPSQALSTNTWYTFKVKRTNNTILCQILNNNSVVAEKSSVAWTSSMMLIFLQLSEYIGKVQWKNLKIQIL